MMDVLRCRHVLKIVRTIVILVSILVINLSTIERRGTKESFSNQAMSKVLLATNLDLAITISGYSPNYVDGNREPDAATAANFNTVGEASPFFIG